jgi:DNA-binding FadR family transcriptional regulator
MANTVGELRRIIEPEATASAALRATPAALAEIENALLVMEATEAASPTSIEADVAFHQSIMVAPATPSWSLSPRRSKPH